MNYFHSAFKIREVSDRSLWSLECYLSFLRFLTHEVNKRCLREFFQQKFLIQLWYNSMNTPGETNFANTYKISDWLSTRPKPCYFMGLLFYTEMAPLLLGMKIIWIKLKPVPLRAKTHKCLLVVFIWLNFIKYGISNCSWGPKEQTFFFFFLDFRSLKELRNLKLSNTNSDQWLWHLCQTLPKLFCLFSAWLHRASWFKLLAYSGSICNSTPVSIWKIHIIRSTDTCLKNNLVSEVVFFNKII